MYDTTLTDSVSPDFRALESAVPRMAPWEAEPYRLWSLLDMLRFFAEEYCEVAALLGGLQQVNEHSKASVDPDFVVTKEAGAQMVPRLEEIKALCEHLHLTMTVKALSRFIEQVKSGRSTFTTHSAFIVDVKSRFHDELSTRHFYYLPNEQAFVFNTPLHGWDGAVAAFPSIVFDLTEAMKALAVERSTASVFHLMRTLEAGIAAIAVELAINKHSPTWQAYLTAMKTAAEAKFPGHGANKEKRDYYANLEAQLRAIKDAFRNPTMHQLARQYSPEEARSISGLVRGFFAEAAKQLHE